MKNVTRLKKVAGKKCNVLFIDTAYVVRNYLTDALAEWKESWFYKKKAVG